MPVGPANMSGHLLAEDAALQTPDALAYSVLSLLMLKRPEISALPVGPADISGHSSISRGNAEYASASIVCKAASSATRSVKSPAVDCRQVRSDEAATQALSSPNSRHVPIGT